MIAACPKCSAKYRVAGDRIGPEGARLRCARCDVVFRVRPPAGAGQVPAPTAVPMETPAAQPDPVAPVQPVPVQGAPVQGAPAFPPSGEGDVSPPTRDPAKLVLVADPDAERAKSSVEAIESWGLDAVAVADGVEAMLQIQRLLPRVVVLDAALPKMYGFQVCEIVKRNESLSSIKVLLVGAIHDSDRYRRAPSDLYGGDSYLEHPDLPEGLASVLTEFGLPISKPTTPDVAASPAPAAAPASPATAPAPAAVAPTTPAPVVPASEQAGSADELAPLRVEAERLARVIVSDVVLYNAERIDEAVQSGDIAGALGGGLDEGREFFRQRVDPRVSSERDFLMEELERVVAQRRAKTLEGV